MWEDSNGFKPDAEGPEDFRGGIGVGVDESEGKGTTKKILHAECIEVGVVGGFEGGGH